MNENTPDVLDYIILAGVVIIIVATISILIGLVILMFRKSFRELFQSDAEREAVQVRRKVKRHMDRFNNLMIDLPDPPTPTPQSKAKNGQITNSDEMVRALFSQLEIRDFKKVIERMPRDMRKQASGMASYENMRMVLQGLVNEHEAILERRKADIVAGLALHETKTYMQATIIALNFEFMLIEMVQNIRAEFDGRLGGDYRDQADRAVARAIARVARMNEKMWGEYIAAQNNENYLPDSIQSGTVLDYDEYTFRHKTYP